MIDNWVFLYINVTQSGPMSIKKKKSIQLTILLRFKTKLMSMKKKKNIHYDFKVKKKNKWRVVSNKCGTQLKFIC
jgi:hypothetical protein